MNSTMPSNRDDRIPKIIHQTFHSKILPEKIVRNIEKIRALNPNWEYRLYDDADIIKFIKDNYDSIILKDYSRINQAYGAARADLFRYLLMYKVGGVYLDIKGSTTIALDEVLKPDDRYLLSNWKNATGEQHNGWGLHPELKDMQHGELQQWHIVATPGHPFLKAVIEQVITNINRYNPGLHGVGKTGVLRLTGPILYTRAISPILHKYPHRFVDSQNDLGFEYSVFGNDNKSHTSIFVSHYSERKDSVVNINPVKKISAPFISLFVRASRKLRKTANSILQRA